MSDSSCCPHTNKQEFVKVIINDFQPCLGCSQSPAPGWSCQVLSKGLMLSVLSSSKVQSSFLAEFGEGQRAAVPRVETPDPWQCQPWASLPGSQNGLCPVRDTTGKEFTAGTPSRTSPVSTLQAGTEI